MKLKDLQGTWRAIAMVDGDYVAENADKIALNIIQQVKAQGGQAIRNGDRVEVVGGNQFWNLPKMPAHRAGNITFRSSDYCFTELGEGKKPSYGKKPKAAQVLTDGFYIEMFNGQKITYKLIGKI